MNNGMQKTGPTDRKIDASVRRLLCVVFVVAGLATSLFAQRIVVDPYNSYYRIYAIVPMIGSGTSYDPARPLYAPAADGINPQSGILGFSSELSDDGTHALIEIVARSRGAFSKLLADSSVTAFVKGSVRPSEIESAFARYKHSFHFSQFSEVTVR